MSRFVPVSVPRLPSTTNALDLSVDGAVERRRRGLGGGLAVALPLLGRLALGGPSVDAGDLVAEGGVDEPVALEGVEGAELRGDDEGGEGLAAAAWVVGSSAELVRERPVMRNEACAIRAARGRSSGSGMEGQHCSEGPRGMRWGGLGERTGHVGDFDVDGL